MRSLAAILVLRFACLLVVHAGYIPPKEKAILDDRQDAFTNVESDIKEIQGIREWQAKNEQSKEVLQTHILDLKGFLRTSKNAERLRDKLEKLKDELLVLLESRVMGSEPPCELSERDDQIEQVRIKISEVTLEFHSTVASLKPQ